MMDEAVKKSIKVGAGAAAYVAVIAIIGAFVSHWLALTLIAMSAIGIWVGVMYWAFVTKLK